MCHGLVLGRTTQGVHRTLERRVEVPCIGSIDDILQLSLTAEKLIHLVRVFVVFGETKLVIDLLILGQCIHDGLHTLHHHLLDGLRGVELRVLGQIAHAISGREYHFALVVLLKSGDNIHQG